MQSLEFRKSYLLPKARHLSNAKSEPEIVSSGLKSKYVLSAILLYKDDLYTLCVASNILKKEYVGEYMERVERMLNLEVTSETEIFQR